jgi:hypothetical protein
MNKKEIEVRVVKHSSLFDDLYCVEWRVHRKFITKSNWKRMLCTIYTGNKTTKDQPVLLNYEEAIRWSIELQQNPELISEHQKKQVKLYQEIKDKFNQIKNNQNE